MRYFLYFLQVPNLVSPVRAKIELMFCRAEQQMEGRLPWPP